MISSSRLVYEFDLSYNRVTSTASAPIELVDKMAILNRALRLVINHLSINSEIDDAAKRALRPLQVKEHELKLLKKNSSFDLYSIPDDLFKLDALKVIASYGECPNKPISVQIFQKDDLNDSLASSFWEPSFPWELVIGDSSSEGYHLIHGGNFGIESAICDYTKFHKELQAPSVSEEGFYIDWNGEKISKDVDLLLDADYVFDFIIEVATLLARSIKGDVNDFNTQLNLIFNKEKITI